LTNKNPAVSISLLMFNYKNISTFILAGGKSSRFKKDKTMFPYLGKPLIEHVIDAASPLGGEISIIANNCSRFKHLQIQCYPDIIKDIGPFGGLYTALHYCSTETALVLGCDMPNISSDLLNYMISVRKDYDIVTPYINGFYEPLYALYSKRCLPYVQKCIEAGEKQILIFYDKVRIRKISEDEIKLFTDPGIVFKNINYPHDVEKS
jgi:molybdenum cofactor guanylyltransferase